MVVIVASALIGLWFFLPPAFEFNRLTATEIANIAIFVVSSGIIVFVANLYRSSLGHLLDRNSEHELLMREFAHRGRNTYAIVESIVRNTLGSDREKEAPGARLRCQRRKRSRHQAQISTSLPSQPGRSAWFSMSS